MAQGFDDDDLREAAAEAGISPAELRSALAERDGGAPSVAPPTTAIARRDGQLPARLDGAIALPPRDALAAVRASIERQTGLHGHLQGTAQADIVDDDRGLTWRVLAQTDEAAGALVRIEVDAQAGLAAQKLALGGVVGLTTAVVGVAWLFGSLMLALGGLGIALVGGGVLGASVMRLLGARRSAEAVAAQALVEAEDQARVER